MDIAIHPNEPCLIDGIHQASKAIALNMLSKWIDIATIAEVTGLAESVIEIFLIQREG
jgi:hypothetical protein